MERTEILVRAIVKREMIWGARKSEKEVTTCCRRIDVLSLNQCFDGQNMNIRNPSSMFHVELQTVVASAHFDNRQGYGQDNVDEVLRENVILPNIEKCRPDDNRNTIFKDIFREFFLHFDVDDFLSSGFPKKNILCQKSFQDDRAN